MAKNIFTLSRLLLIALILTAAFTASVVAQTTYSVPKKVALGAVVRRAFPQYFGGNLRYPQLIAEGFFPIGWSRDGKFAYYTEPVDEACGCYFAELIIQDLRTDKVLWKFDYDQDQRQDANGKMPPENTIAKLWAKNRKLFSDKLRENGIVQLPAFTLLAKTFVSRGNSYTARVSAPPGKDDDGMDRVESVTATLSSPKLGKKELYTASYKKDMYTAPLDAGVVGVFLSPFENSAAIIIIEADRGYEGPPNTANVRIVGADLLSGFKSGK